MCAFVRAVVCVHMCVLCRARAQEHGHQWELCKLEQHLCSLHLRSLCLWQWGYVSINGIPILRMVLVTMGTVKLKEGKVCFFVLVLT